ncbi:hypothetical protein ADK37_15485 [Streptomyces resistomycificus]|uniref:Uncharacterized protein n=1 Tax=Streptomyces resistomycificus TaxID=67356 RepID=A0A0L8LBD2_9ACTN|nr:hypothetical protein ADK37_15485 [Streptomyces resistomycificus]
MQLGSEEPAARVSSEPTPVPVPPPAAAPSEPPAPPAPPEPDPVPAADPAPSPEPPPDPPPDPDPPEPPPLDSSLPPGAWLIAGPEPEGPGVIVEGEGFLSLDPPAPLSPPPPPEVTIQAISSANRAVTDSSTALRRQ